MAWALWLCPPPPGSFSLKPSFNCQPLSGLISIRCSLLSGILLKEITMVFGLFVCFCLRLALKNYILRHCCAWQFLGFDWLKLLPRWQGMSECRLLLCAVTARWVCHIGKLLRLEEERTTGYSFLVVKPHWSAVWLWDHFLLPWCSELENTLP